MNLEQTKPQKTPIYCCDKCVFTTSNKKDYRRHNSTRKHIVNVQSNSIEQLFTQKTPEQFICSCCKKEYQSKSGLWYHTKKCSQPIVPEPLSENTLTLATATEHSNNAIIMELMKQNQEFKNMLLELAREPKVVNNNITNNNSNNTNKTNNQFNLNTFLNEDCKNAMNMNQFIDSIKLTVKDLEETGRLGFVDGLSRILINALNELELTDRPIHCTDVKRETVYIKDENKWEKENIEKPKLVNVLRKIENKNMKMLPTWIHDNPECRVMDSPEFNQYIQISKSSLGYPDKESIEKQDDKIIKNVLKEVMLNKPSN